MLSNTLPPRHVLYRLTECTLFSIATYFVLDGCPRHIAVAGFIALPLLGAALFRIRQGDMHCEKQVLGTPVKLTRKLWALLLSIGPRSTAQKTADRNAASIPRAHTHSSFAKLDTYSKEKLATLTQKQVDQGS